jgi:hypothetical protein
METQLCIYCNNQVNLDMFRKNRKKCKNCEKKDGREYRQNDYGKQKAILWSINNKQRHTELQSEWHKNNRRHLNDKYNARIKVDFNFKMKKLCNNHLHNNINKKTSTMKYFSCDITLFINWLKYCFTDKMNMDNHGSYWHLDHVIPVSLFNLENEEELRLCFHYLNYMPLPGKENIKKQNKIMYSQLITHLNNIINFHIKNELDIDKKYFQLLARHLIMTGNSLEF